MKTKLKLTQKLFYLTVIGLAWNANARKLGVDFAYVTQWDEATEKDVPLVNNGIGVGWHVAGLDVRYDLVNSDPDYATKLLTDHGDLFNGSVFNLLYDAKTGEALNELDKPKDPKTHKVDDSAACFDAAGFGSGHISCTVFADPASGFSLFQINSKWYTSSIEAVKFEGVKAVGFGQLTNRGNDLFRATLDKKYAKNPKYKTDADDLVYEYTVKALKPGKDASEAIVTASGYAEVIKGNNTFETTVNGKVKLTYDGAGGVTLSPAPPPAATAPVQK